MSDKLNVVEIDRRSVAIRRESDFLRDGRNRLDQQLNAMLDMKRRAWEQGFAAAMDMMAQQNELARGTRELDHEEITAPYPIIDPTVIEAD